jgi:hypothetical protein
MIESTTDKVRGAVDSLRMGVPEDGLVRSKHVTHKYETYISLRFSDIFKHFNK